MPQSQVEFPLTLAEVLFQELYADPMNAAETAAAALLNQQIVAARKNANPTLALKADCWFTAEEQADWDLKQKASNEIVPTIYQAIHKLDRSALCLSGGGVRSATFNFGILQGLARHDLLQEFDYLSTVSGGGFIGSWLTAWIHRSGLNNVVSELQRPRGDTPLDPEPEQVYNLRVYANYLTPKKGLSADTFTLLAVGLRNLLLNWLVFIPVLVAFLMIPRISVAFVRSSYVSATVCLFIGFFAAALALVYIGTNLPARKQFNWSRWRFVVLCLAPLVLSAIALTTYWVRLGAAKPRIRYFVLFSLSLALVSWILCQIIRIGYSGNRMRPEDKQSAKASAARAIPRFLAVTVLILSAFAVIGAVTAYLVTTQLSSLQLHDGHARIFASLAVPSLLVLLSLGGTLIAGLTSQYTHSDDQEWWARSGGWILIVVAVWAVFHLLVLFGPSIFVDLQTQIINKQNLTGLSIKGVVTGLVGIISGVVALLGGFSPKTHAHGGEPGQDTGPGSKLLPMITTVAAAIFAVFIVIVLALISDWILASGFGNSASRWLGGPDLSKINFDAPREIIYASPGRLLVVLATLIAVVGVGLGRLINTNKFSLHYYWRNRMMRAYMGASRKNRDATKDLFTDFDMADDLPMHKLKYIQQDDAALPEIKQKPMHVLVVTLNLVGGDKLAWQDRKAESFTISPRHSGSYWLGYRDSEHYGEGITLATAAALSGAAASPNMGFMMTSPIVRILMTLFNIRMGFWLGNPGLAGNKPGRFRRSTYDRNCPRSSVRPIVAEALGRTDDKHPYVYLSDGGHFENFGLYEMILRRCRFIVVGDGSSDADYDFQSLALAIRQIRVDFGVPIDMEKMVFGNDPPEVPSNYCAIGTIRYSCIDNTTGDPTKDEDYDGVLIYLKPSLIGGEPRDVTNYHRVSSDFPQDTIADQWFSEAQFESYRMLGSHMIATICAANTPDKPRREKFIDQVRANVRQ
jgi:hypothetical protein